MLAMAQASMPWTSLRDFQVGAGITDAATQDVAPLQKEDSILAVRLQPEYKGVRHHTLPVPHCCSHETSPLL